MKPDALGAGTTLGYCTNVHAGTTLGGLMSELEVHACAVRERLGGGDRLGIGLWLPAAAVPEATGASDEFAAWLEDRRLVVFTMNGFPQGDFHEAVVKRRVYEPTWADDARLDHTLALARLLVRLAPTGEASISTLPVCWKHGLDRAGLNRAARNLAVCAEALAQLEAETGVLVHLDLEPEPGCHFDTAAGAVAWIERVARGGDDDTIRRHLRVCHDVCHSAVMFETQDAAFDAYERGGVRVGKIQISSALAVPFEDADGAGGLCAPDRTWARTQLRDFAEERYLHQTVVRRGDGVTRFFEDLPEALASDDAIGGTWRIHYHLPVFLERIGALETTRDEIRTAVARARACGVRHFEVETYAWGVLPAAVAPNDLATGIARELAWVATECAP